MMRVKIHEILSILFIIRLGYMERNVLANTLNSQIVA